MLQLLLIKTLNERAFLIRLLLPLIKLWSQRSFTFLKPIGDSKKLLLLWIISINVYCVASKWECIKCVNPWPLVPLQQQQESPIWGAVKKEILCCANSSTVIQHGCENSTAVGPSAVAALFCPTPLHSVALHTGLVCSAPLQSGKGSLQGKVRSMSQGRAGLYG